MHVVTRTPASTADSSSMFSDRRKSSAPEYVSGVRQERRNTRFSATRDWYLRTNYTAN